MALWGRTEDGRAIVVLDPGDTLDIAALAGLGQMSLLAGPNLPDIVAKVNELITRQNKMLDALRRRN